MNPLNGLLSEQMGSFEDDVKMAPKMRKPYTITKQREKWTEEEHKKFLEALQLYGRVWRRIEEHIGSKTSVQIRSHAQKFFSKVAREANSKVEIPPPRPKRKSNHPYPRKQIISAVRSEALHSFISSKSNRNISPVVSVEGSNEQKNGIQSPDGLTTEDKSKSELDLSSEDSKKTSTLKLFGRTILVTDYANLDEGNSTQVIQNEINGGSSMCSFHGGCFPLFYSLATYEDVVNSAAEDGMITLPLWGFCWNMTFPVANTHQNFGYKEELAQINVQNECSDTGSNAPYERGNVLDYQQDQYSEEKEMKPFMVPKIRENLVCSNQKAVTDSKSERGFVPYKKIVAEEKVE